MTATHGRYLIEAPEAEAPVPILAGFHGYAEDAETQMERLQALAQGAGWLLVSMQALHRFYERRTNRVVASWMTRQDRESAIADNVAYVSACIEAAASEWPSVPEIIFAGFSQGVAMAYRAAANSVRRAGVIAVGGDIPPELTGKELQRVSGVLMARGMNDELYRKDNFAGDERRLRECGVTVRTLEYKAGHEWTAEVSAAGSHFLSGFYPRQLSDFPPFADYRLE